MLSKKLDNLFADDSNATHGFTLVELIVALGIFTTVVFGVTAALLSVVAESQRARSSQRAINNLNVAVDDMVRNMSTGFYYDCEGDDATDRGDVNCPPGSADVDDEISFVNQSRNQVGYWLNADGEIMKEETGGINQAVNQSGDDTMQLTSPNLSIDTLAFHVRGAQDDDNEQSTVLITVTGTAGSGDTAETFTVQTSVTKRLLNP